MGLGGVSDDPDWTLADSPSAVSDFAQYIHPADISEFLLDAKQCTRESSVMS